MKLIYVGTAPYYYVSSVRAFIATNVFTRKIIVDVAVYTAWQAILLLGTSSRLHCNPN